MGGSNDADRVWTAPVAGTRAAPVTEHLTTIEASRVEPPGRGLVFEATCLCGWRSDPYDAQHLAEEQAAVHEQLGELIERAEARDDR
jgi:hypothetical protein